MPSVALVAPTATAPIPEIATRILGLQDWLSASNALGLLIDHITGVNPYEWGGRLLAGDWEAFGKAADAAENLGQYLALQGSGVSAVSTALDNGWDGQAAQAAVGWFEAYAGQLTELQSALDGVAESFRTTSAGVQLAAEGLKSALTDLSDLAIAFALELLAAASTSWTGVGAAIGGAAAAYTAWEARQVWLEALQWHGRAVALGEMLPGLIAGYAGMLRGLDGVSLPHGAYDHAQA